jgi:putative NAD(P)-binding protein
VTQAAAIVGGGFAGLVRAVEDVRRGVRVDYVEPGLRAGGALVTESFLSPFRFNLGPALVRRPPLPSLHVFEPDPLVRVGRTVGRGSTAVRAFLAGGETDDLVVVSGGNGLAAACLVDEVVAGGSRVVEGVGPVDRGTPHHDGLGVARLFVGLRGPAPVGDAFATAVGTGDETALVRGDANRAVGFVISNSHLDANLVDPSLSSFVWQAALPFGAALSREAYSDRVLAALGVERAHVVFKLLWLPEDTGEVLPAAAG